MAVWTVYAEWSDADQVWFSRASDMHGLHVDADTVDKLVTKAAAHIADLLEINADILTEDDRQAPHIVRVVAHHERAQPIAA